MKETERNELRASAEQYLNMDLTRDGITYTFTSFTTDVGLAENGGPMVYSNVKGNLEANDGTTIQLPLREIVNLFEQNPR